MANGINIPGNGGNEQVNPKDRWLFYLAPMTYNRYNGRLQVYNKINVSWIVLPYKISCEDNNICLFGKQYLLVLFLINNLLSCCAKL